MPTQKELNDRYGDNLSVTSNDAAIIQRDEAGNMSSDLTDTIYIEPVTWAYDNDSINQIIDTRFSYYKFPPRLIVDDNDIPDEIDVESVAISYDSKYKAESQDIPTIELFIPNDNKINYGWNWPDGKTGLAEPADQLSPGGQATRYYNAHIQARDQVVAGTSDGRFRLSNVPGYDKFYDINSLFEGHFKKIKFTEVISGLPQTQPGCFVINKDLIDSNKSMEFNVQIAVSHLDNHGRNTFMIRLVRHRSMATVNSPYEVLKVISSNDQGASTLGDNKTPPDFVFNLKKSKEELENIQLQLITQRELFRVNAVNDVRARIELASAEQTLKNAWAKFIIPFYGQAYLVIYTNARINKERAQYRLINLLNEKVAIANIINQLEVEENAARERYNIDIRNSQIDLKSIEAALNGQYTYLWQGKTFFNLKYILKSEDMKLDDIYSIEMLANKPQEVKHELIEENTYWDITEIKPDKVYDKSADMWRPQTITKNINNSTGNLSSNILNSEIASGVGMSPEGVKTTPAVSDAAPTTAVKPPTPADQPTPTIPKNQLPGTNEF